MQIAVISLNKQGSPVLVFENPTKVTLNESSLNSEDDKKKNRDLVNKLMEELSNQIPKSFYGFGRDISSKKEKSKLIFGVSSSGSKLSPDIDEKLTQMSLHDLNKNSVLENWRLSQSEDKGVMYGFSNVPHFVKKSPNVIVLLS